jgi:para-aminobenzoate synthetase
MITHRDEQSIVVCPELFRIEFKVLDFLPNPLDVFRLHILDSRSKFFLESSLLRPGFSRFSFMGDSDGPYGETITYNSTTKKAVVETKELRDTFFTASVFEFLEQRLNQRKVDVPNGLPFDFNLGYVGFMGYELKGETIGTNAYNSESHDLALIFASRVIAFDHKENKTYLLHLVTDIETRNQASKWFEEVGKNIANIPSGISSEELSNYTGLRQSMTLLDVERWIAENAIIRHNKKNYINKILEALKEIENGESYEVCLTNIIDFDFPESPFDLYCVMREMSPAPHAGYFSIGDFHLVSSSPERFLAIDKKRQVEARPIKGTRPRGKTIDDDEALIKNLQTHEKDRAENLMIVDLLRNDLGRVCTISSVRVPRIFDVETYSHVHQLVSTICGVLKQDVSTMQCIRAVFPGGSMTGAPKKRTMEIIDRLEEGPRGAYSGALGWFGLGGACDLNIIIRSISIEKGKARFGIGGALTWLSDPEEEFLETIVKARGLVEAVERLRGQRP